ncbi:hypothetical protein CHL67_02305 [Prosthecochloris sp. GSB1]|uniref:hypothetical protein n=1 Tax=Prosthecochloris sp. GSB1 TaxID=281093 RepID=UPI000B8D1961|nr:hypothetical protein [Prosthecochloris sp. GSB1]ASQ89905.1 hypothetical protein CHL67_02305 [Prosthecochloris sp. GSB1]
MEQFFTTLSANPLYLAVAVIAAIAVLLLFLRKILRLLVILTAVLVLYVAYLKWSGERVPDAVREIEKNAVEFFRKGGEVLRDFQKDGMGFVDDFGDDSN